MVWFNCSKVPYFVMGEFLEFLNNVILLLKRNLLEKSLCEYHEPSIQFSHQLYHLILCYPMDCSTPGFPVCHQLLELAQTHVHQVGDALQPSHPLSPPSPPAFSLSQHQGLFK